MKILVVSQYFYPENFIINDLVRSLSLKNIELTVLTAYPNYPSGKLFSGYKQRIYQTNFLYKNVEVIRMPIILRGSASFLRLSLNYLSFIISSSLIAPFLFKKRKFDIVFVYAPSPIFQTYIGILLKKITKAKLITWVQDLWPESLLVTGYLKNKYLLKVLSFFVKIAYKYSDLILFSSKGFERKIKQLSPKSKVLYFPNPGAKKQNINLNILNKNFYNFKSGFNVTFAGNLGKAQSLGTILDAAENVLLYPDIKFYLVGNGSQYNWLKEEIKKRKLKNIFMTGRIEGKLMPIVYEKSSVLLVTLKKSEILGLTVPAKLQAYMAASKPIISCVDGEVANIVNESQCGIACESENSNQLTDAIVNFYNTDPKKLKKFGLNGKKYFNKNFELSFLTYKLIEIFRNILQK